MAQIQPLNNELNKAMQLRQGIEERLRIYPDKISKLTPIYQAAIVGMLYASSLEELKRYASRLSQLICLLPHAQNPSENLTQMIGDLYTIKQQSLPKPWWRTIPRAGETSWIMLDGGLLILSVLSLLLPELAGLPVLILTIGAMAYAAGDVIKNTFYGGAQTLNQTDAPLLETSNLITEHDPEILKHFKDPPKIKQLAEKELQNLAWRDIFFCGIGLICATIGFAFLFPPLALPFAAVLAATIINGMATLGATKTFIDKRQSEQRRLKNIEEEGDEALKKATELLHKPLVSLDSTRLMIGQGITSSTSRTLNDTSFIDEEKPSITQQPQVSPTPQVDEDEDEGEGEHPHIKRK